MKQKFLLLLVLVPLLYLSINSATASEGFHLVRFDLPLLIPSALVLPKWQVQLTPALTSTFKGSAQGENGSGNQTYHAKIEMGVGHGWQFGLATMVNDDPTYNTISGDEKDQYWGVVAFSSTYQFLEKKDFFFSVKESVEYAYISAESGLYSSGGTIGNCNFTLSKNSSKNIPANCRKSLIGSVALPVTWKLIDPLYLDFVPGVVLFPQDFGSQGFYGSVPYIGFNINWQIVKWLRHYESVMFPLSGANSVTNSNQLQRNPVWRAGLACSLDPATTLNGYLTNSFGGTPATHILTYPSAPNIVAFGASLSVNLNESGANFLSTETKDPITPSLTPVKTANLFFVPFATVLPLRTTLVSTNINTEASWGTNITYGLSENFQIGTYLVKINDMAPATQVSSGVVDGIQYRFEGKFSFLSEKRDAPISVAFQPSIGWESHNDQGYAMSDFTAEKKFADFLSLLLDYRFTLNGGKRPHAVAGGVDTEIWEWLHWMGTISLPLRSGFDVIGTSGFRVIPESHLGLDLYVTNASSQRGIGSFLSTDTVTFGGELNVVF